jgi:hypothetical protein
MNSGLFDFWLRFGSVTGLFKPAPSPKPCQKSKILAAHRYIFSVNALAAVFPFCKYVVVFPQPGANSHKPTASAPWKKGIESL